MQSPLPRRRCGRCSGYLEQPNFPPRYNVAPTQPVPIVRMVEGEREFALVRWGLIPAWVKDPRGFSLLINARGESVLDKPAFRNAMKRRRCLFPADGFYEWKREGDRKRPYFVRLQSGQPDGLRGPVGDLDAGRTARRWRLPRSSPRAASRSIAHDPRPHAGDRRRRRRSTSGSTPNVDARDRRRRVIVPAPDAAAGGL